MHSCNLNLASNPITKILLLFIILIQGSIAFAQPKPCTDPPTMTSFCKQACIICDIDGYTGRNGTGGQGEAPPGFCTTYLHNAKWIAFIAGSVDLKIRMSVSNCTQKRGLELGIYEGIDCKNYKLVSNCRGGANTAVAENTSAIFQNIVPLTIGQYYYIVMDGSNGSVCDWTFDVLEGSTQVAPLSTSGVIDGPSVTCFNELDHFTTSGDVGATIFDWTVNGVDIPNGGQDINITWPKEGMYEVCVTASNVCDKAPPSCKTVTVMGNVNTNIDATICEGGIYIVDENTQVDAPGEYDYKYTDQHGCDSLVHISLTQTNANIANIALNICDGDSIYIGTTPYFQTGDFTEMIQNDQGCDSIVNLSLNLVVCEMKGSSVPESAKCFGDNSGTLTFSIQQGTPPFDYNWRKVNSTINGQGMLVNINQDEIITGLGSGTYLITVTDGFGNDVIIIGTVNEPLALAATADVSDFSGYNVSCNGGQNGSINVNMTGGTQPYSYLWPDGSLTKNISGLAAGDYNVTLSDVNGCPLFYVININEPPSLSLQFTTVDPNCDGLNTGSIKVVNSAGGIIPYEFKLNNGTFEKELTFEGLQDGQYLISMKDGNGCIDTTQALLTGKIIPTLSINDDVTIKLSDEIQLASNSNIIIDDIKWNPPTGLSCNDCPNPVARPFLQTTYVASITSIDGCVTSDSLTIRVDESRRVFVPNVFSPNNDGINDIFSIVAGPEVTKILSFKVYNRWGAQVFEELQFAPETDKGWDGSFRGKEVEGGVFAWFAIVEFLDGKTKTFKGDVTVVR